MKTIWNMPKVDLISLGELEEKRQVGLIYSGPAWKAVEKQLNLPVVWRAEVFEATIDHWDKLMHGFQGEVVYSVGGGLTADAAKYFSVKNNLPLVVIPTALSVDAFMTAASGIRRNGCVYYVETKTPENLILDLDMIASAPAWIRAAGITDVLSIATGCWDWKYADENKKNPPGMEFIQWVYDNAQSILNGVLDCAEAAGRGDLEGLKTLYDCLAMEVQLCNQIGHARPEEGSEHYFAYCVENMMGHGLPHGDLVGPGILLMAERQGQDMHPYEAALKACNIPLDRIPSETIRGTFAQLPEYCEKHGLAFGLAHTLQ